MTGNTVTLAWDPNSAGAAVGYRLYQGAASRNYTSSIDAGAKTSLTVSNLAAGVPYFFAVTAYNSNRLESDFSAEVSYTIPATSSASAVPAPRPILQIQITSTRQVVLSGVGPAGHTYEVQTAADLDAWTSIGQVTTDNSGSFRFTDPTPANLASCSYRLRESPAPQTTGTTTTNAIQSIGAYNGLFHETTQVFPRSSGSLTVSANSRGVYTGKLQIGNSRYSFSGHLNLQSQATNIVLRRNDRALTVGFGLVGDSLYGQVTDGTWTASLSGERTMLNSPPCPWAGAYTFIIPGSSGDPSVPAGHSFGTARVNAAGRLTFAGTLADGARVSQSIQLTRSGRWPLYLSLYSGNGSLTGWIGFERAAASDFSGSLFWTELPNLKSRYYPAGFSRSCQALGSTYVSSALSTNRVLNLADAHLIFLGGNLNSAVTNAVGLNSSGRITRLGKSPGTGVFKGTAIDPLLKKSFPFSGVVFQKQNLGYGLLFGDDQTSQVLLAP